MVHTHILTLAVLADSGETWVWFGIRSDGRCGRDYAHEGQLSAGETQCGKGQCCSSHGWCGHGEEYCSVSMGCQSGCWPASGADEAKRDADDHYRHNEHVRACMLRAHRMLTCPDSAALVPARWQSAAPPERRRSLPALNPRAAN